MIRHGLRAFALLVSVAVNVFAIDPGKAVGTITLDGAATRLAFAVETRQDNLFDAGKQDVVYILTDKPLGATRPDDQIELSMRAHRGELVVLALRIDGSTLVNASVRCRQLNGLAILPGSWFEQATITPGLVRLQLPKHDYEGHSVSIDVLMFE